MFEMQFDNEAIVYRLDNEKRELEKQFEEKTKDLIISENKFATAFRYSPDIIITISAKIDGRIIDVNSTHEKHSGYKREELIGTSLYALGI